MKHILTLLLIIGFTCLNGQEMDESFIKYSKGACMGQCPVYSIQVNKSGLLTYQGILNVERQGIWKRQLSKKEFRKLSRKFNCAKLGKLDDEYGTEIMDAPMTTLTYEGKKINKTIKVKGEKPEKLINVESYLHQLLEDDQNNPYEWSVEESPMKFGEQDLAGRTIIIELNEGVIFDEWVVKYDQYGVKLERQLSPILPLFLISFNQTTIQQRQLLVQFTRDKEVKSAEANKKVKMR